MSPARDPGLAPALGVYVIRSVAHNTQVITPTTSGTVVGSHSEQPLPATQKWQVGHVDNGHGGSNTSLRNIKTKKYLGLDAKNNFIETHTPLGWAVLSVSRGYYRIHDLRYQTADVELNGSTDGAPLTFGNYQNLPTQHWDFQAVY